ncbi:TetR/AcrR family transcriptional regulator [Dactylosporangium sp. CA-233914]|uniref:TetR/AcrR family transcriptional regulator n=1 Tax=Dactylosporangium sp. CA-233914 TaxID=3239934 RepID=UPI003D8C7B09
MTNANHRINRAALELFAKKGFAATGIRDLAEAAGVSTASLYHYMGTKDDLLERIILRGMERTIAYGRGVAVLSEDPATQLVGLVQAHVCLHTTYRHETRVLDLELRSLRKTTHATVVELRDSYEQIWADILNRGMAAGTFDIPDQHVARLALIEMCNGTGLWYNPKGSLTIAQVAHTTADLALGLVRAKTADACMRIDDLSQPIPYAHIERIVTGAFGDLLG